MVQVLGHVARLQTGLLHHEVAHGVQVAMAAGQVVPAVCVLVARGGHFLLGRHHRAAFTTAGILLLGLVVRLRVEQVLLELLWVERVGDLLGYLARPSGCSLR